jgi:predicted dehydrogenase
MIRIGMLGAGRAAGSHTEQLRNRSGVTIDAVACRSGPADFMQNFGLEATPYTSHTELCDHPNLDAIIICTPTHLHREHILAAVERDLDILCEKPIVREVMNTEGLPQRLAQSDSMFLPGHTVRYMEPFVHVRDRIQDGSIGEVLSVSVRRLSSFPRWGSEDWFADFEKSGGVVLDMGIHDIDFVEWAIDDLVSVSAVSNRWQHAEQANIVGTCDGGAVVNIEASWAQPSERPFTVDLEVTGTDGTISLIQQSADFRGTASGQGSDSGQMVVTEWSDGSRSSTEVPNSGWKRQATEFISCVQGNKEPKTSLTESLRSVRVANAANEAAETGTKVDVRDAV